MTHRHFLALTSIGLLAFTRPRPVDAQPAAPSAACQSTVTGDLRVHQLTSRTFANTRSIRVLLPKA